MRSEFLEIDGSRGEGGGQILRSSLALSIGLGRPFQIRNIRARRKRPGLLRQHLACVRLAAAVSGAGVQGAELGSTELLFQPGPLIPGSYEIAVGSAGSTTLVLQSVLPCLLRSSGSFEFEISGGTHNPMAPPFGFLDACFLPILRRMGADVQVDLERPGFFPAGGGRIRARISPSRPHPLELLERGREGRHRSHLGLAHLPAEILQREIQTLAEGLHWPNNRFIEEDVSSSAGPGNILDVRLEFEHITHVLTQFGAPGVGGIGLAKQLVNKTRSYLRGSAPVGTQLADQLMLPMAFLAGGRFRAYHVDDHGTSNAEVIEQFAPGTVTIHERGREGVLVEVNPLFPA